MIAACERDFAAVAAAPRGAPGAAIRLHGDCHLGNVLDGAAGLFFVDFDDMVVGPAVQDLWLLLPGRDAAAQRALGVLLAAYETMRPFDRAQLRLIEPLRALRFVHFAAWIGKRWQDPAFPRAFPQFGSPKYWQEQVADLNDQLAAMREGVWENSPADGWAADEDDDRWNA